MPFPVRNHRTTKGYKVKYIKMLGLSMVAAIAVMAFVGAGSASATVVCALTGTTQGTCPTGEFEYNGPVEGTSKEDVLTSGFAVIKCEGKMSGEINSAGIGSIKAVTWSACKNNLGCTTTSASPVEKSLPWSASVVTGGEMTVKNAEGSFSIGGTCIAPSTCIYSATEVHPHFDNHKLNEKGELVAAQILASKLPLKKVKEGSSASCSETGEWSATYNLVSGKGADLSVH
jgi:hypothetical protein